MNYAQLTQAITDYTENYESSFITNIPTFVKQAEQRIYNSVQFPSLRKSVTGSLTTGNKYVATPTDFLAPHSLAVINTNGEYTYLLNKDVNFIREAYPSPADTGLPRHYALFGPTTSGTTLTTELSLLVGPTPDNAYAIELHYFYYPESIVTASTTWLGDNLDSVLLYGALVEAYTYMKGEQDMMTYYDGKYKEALGMAKRLGDGLERQDTYRSGQFRQQVT